MKKPIKIWENYKYRKLIKELFPENINSTYQFESINPIGEQAIDINWKFTKEGPFDNMVYVVTEELKMRCHSTIIKLAKNVKYDNIKC